MIMYSSVFEFLYNDNTESCAFPCCSSHCKTTLAFKPCLSSITLLFFSSSSTPLPLLLLLLLLFFFFLFVYSPVDAGQGQQRTLGIKSSTSGVEAVANTILLSIGGVFNMKFTDIPAKDQKGVDAIVKVINDGLKDPFSKKYEKEELAEVMSTIENRLSGIEIMLDIKDNHETLGKQIAKGAGLAAQVSLTAAG